MRPAPWTALALLTLSLPVTRSETARTADGFLVPESGHTFIFPADHGSHPGFKIEWWYVTGHLRTVDSGPQTRFGFQATFFRQASPDGTTNVYLAHMAVVNVTTGQFLHQERLNRSGWDAEAATDHLDLHHGPWSLRMPDPVRQLLQLRGGVRAEALFDLELAPVKPLVVFGENGVSRKGSAPTAASYYLTYSRLLAHGTLTWQGLDRAVEGQAWMDHEISSSQLDTDQVGWDWLSLQLTDGREIMLYRLRRRDGRSDPASTLTWVDASGRIQREPFNWQVESTWTSSASGARYPAHVLIQTTDPATGQPVALRVRPLVAQQELNGQLDGIPYWEGACTIADASTDSELGEAYMELTGYAQDLKL